MFKLLFFVKNSADHCVSTQCHCGSNRLCANLRRSQSARILSSPLLCVALRFYSNPRFAFADQSVSTPLAASPLRCRSGRICVLLCPCCSIPSIAYLCHRTTYRCCSLPLLCNTSLFLSYALCLLAMPSLLNSSHVIATQYRCASTHSALCLCLAIPSLLRNTIASRFYSSLCHCHATLHPSGAYFGVAHRSGPRNMALAYRLHHDQVWHLPHDGADDVDLVRF